MPILRCLAILVLSLSTIIDAQTLKYPSTPLRPVTDDYFGTKVTDNYRWLEDLNDPVVQSWLKSQSEFSNSILNDVPDRQLLVNELKGDRTRIAPQFVPFGMAGGKYFYGKILPGEQTPKLFYRNGRGGKEVLLFDPEKYVDGRVFEFSAKPSFDGSRLLLSLYEAGQELGDVRLIDVYTRTFMPDVLPHSRPISFAGESNTDIVYYEYKSYDMQDPANRLNIKAKLHTIGTKVDSDIVLACAEKYPELLTPADIPSVAVIPGCPYVLMSKVSTEAFRTRYYAPRSDLKGERIKWRLLTSKQDEVRDLFVRGKDIYLLTSKGNPFFRLIKTDLDDPDIAKAKVIFDGTSDWKLDAVGLTKDFLIFSKSHNALIVKAIAYDLRSGKLSELKGPSQGNLYFDVISEGGNELALVSSGWNTPEQVRSYDLDRKRFFKGPYDSGYDIPELRNVVFEEVEVPSHDRVLVPLSIVYDKTRLKKDGSNTAFMDAYGAYGRTPLVPAFRPETLPLLRRGVVLAYAHIRGGGEKGRDWYLGGKKSTKPNTWKDLNACAAYLESRKYTSPDKLGIIGSSAGGIAIGRAITERPELYRVAIVRAGLLNTMRLEFSPNGPSNIPEFGTVKIEDEFRALFEMDAMHHIRSGIRYPAQIISAGINDPRVACYIPAKFAAAMQASTGSNYPVLLDINYKSGHFGGVTQDEQIEETAKEYAFLLWQTGHPEFQN